MPCPHCHSGVSRNLVPPQAGFQSRGTRDFWTPSRAERGIRRGDDHACDGTDGILLKSTTLGIEGGTRLIHDLERKQQSDRIIGCVGVPGQA